MNDKIAQLLFATRDAVKDQIKVARAELKQMEKLSKRLVIGLNRPESSKMPKAIKPKKKKKNKKKKFAATNGHARFDTSKFGEKSKVPKSFYEAVSIATADGAKTPRELLPAIQATGYKFNAKQPMNSIFAQLRQGQGKRYKRMRGKKWIVKAGAKVLSA